MIYKHYDKRLACGEFKQTLIVVFRLLVVLKRNLPVIFYNAVVVYSTALPGFISAFDGLFVERKKCTRNLITGTAAAPESRHKAQHQNAPRHGRGTRRIERKARVVVGGVLELDRGGRSVADVFCRTSESHWLPGSGPRCVLGVGRSRYTGKGFPALLARLAEHAAQLRHIRANWRTGW